MTTATPPRAELVAAIEAAVASVDDPEYPGVSIVDLGLLEQIELTDDRARVTLVPTFSGCPALAMIRADVEAAVAVVPGVASVEVVMATAPAWTPERISEAGRRALADGFTVAVEIGGAPTRCPRCGGATERQSPFGPTRCRAVHRCSACDEVVEVVR